MLYNSKIRNDLMECSASISEFAKRKTIKDIKISGLPDRYDDSWNTNFQGQKLRIDFVEGSSILIDSLFNTAEFLPTPEALKRAN